jgi:hypothetical protein
MCGPAGAAGRKKAENSISGNILPQIASPLRQLEIKALYYNTRKTSGE